MASISRNLRRSLAPDRLRRLLLLSQRPREYVTAECHRPVVLHKRGPDILHDPWFNRVRLGSVPFRPGARGRAGGRWYGAPCLVRALGGSELLTLLAAAGHGVLDDREGPPRPPWPAPAQRRLLAAADRQIQYVCPRPDEPIHCLLWLLGFATRCMNRRGSNWIGRCSVEWFSTNVVFDGLLVSDRPLGLVQLILQLVSMVSIRNIFRSYGQTEKLP
jgi:malate dehydrogenase (decarboxylating)